LETEVQIKQIILKMLKSISLGTLLVKDDNNNYSFDKNFIKKYNIFIKYIKKIKNNDIRKMVKNV
jgi:hypothetical protein